MIKKIVSGGQTGVDRAALDTAIELNISHGGWCPKGRLAELGETIPETYELIETETADYSQRTKLNIRDSDGTLILVPEALGEVTDGTILTITEVERLNKSHYIIDISKDLAEDDIIHWINDSNILILNIAGPRESQCPGIYLESKAILKKLLLALQARDEEDKKPKALFKR